MRPLDPGRIQQHGGLGGISPAGGQAPLAHGGLAPRVVRDATPVRVIGSGGGIPAPIANPGIAGGGLRGSKGEQQGAGLREPGRIIGQQLPRPADPGGNVVGGIRPAVRHGASGERLIEGPNVRPANSAENGGGGLRLGVRHAGSGDRLEEASPLIRNSPVHAPVVQRKVELEPRPAARPPVVRKMGTAALGEQAPLRSSDESDSPTKGSLKQALQDPERLQMLVGERFRDMTRQKRTTYLEIDDMDNLALKLSLELNISKNVFGEINQMFWRFDFSGDGKLDEHEGTQLILFMIRKYRDSISPPEPGQVKLGGRIKWKSLDVQYETLKKLGEGGQGVAKLVRDKKTGDEACVKLYDKSNPSAPMEDITQEFELLIGLKHPRIAHVFDIFQDTYNVYVVQEAYFGGDLTTIVQKAVDCNVPINEAWLANIFNQIAHGVSFLHSKYVIHCDLKEPNVMVASGREDDLKAPQIVLIDFGLANFFHSKTSPGGTPGYMPPEVWPPDGLWTPKGDMFSIGVMLFNMRTGINPFIEGAGTLEEIMKRTKKDHAVMDMGTDELKLLVSRMLDKSFLKRISIHDFMKHPWLTGGQDQEIFHTSILQSLARKGQKNQLHRALLADVAANTNLAQMRELNDLFLGIDKDGDGMISADEVRECLGDRWPAERVEKLISVLIGDSESVAYDEFMGQLIASKAPEEKELLNKMFSEADTDKSGYISQFELGQLMKRPAVQKVLGNKRPDEVMRMMDPNNKGQISFDDFCRGFYGDTKSDFCVGQGVEFYSSSYSQWIPCEVTRIDDKSGAIQVSVKPDHWLTKVEASQRVRIRRKDRKPTAKGPFQMPVVKEGSERSEEDRAKISGMGRQLFHGGMSSAGTPQEVIAEGKDLLKKGWKQVGKFFK